jgi:hypothetical protein
MICLPGATAFVPLWLFLVCRITIFISQDFSSKKGRQTKLKQLAEEKKPSFFTKVHIKLIQL